MVLSSLRIRTAPISSLARFKVAPINANTYTVDAQAFDALVRDAKPDDAAFTMPGNQEMVIVFATGNRGSTFNTVGAPGTSKNVITVGASEGVRSLNSASGACGCSLKPVNATFQSASSPIR